MAIDKKGGGDRKEAQAAMLSAIKEIRSDSKRYDELKAKLSGIKSDEDRAKVLLDFVVDDDRLRASIPEDQNLAAATTVTVTTVLIFAPSAY